MALTEGCYGKQFSEGVSRHGADITGLDRNVQTAKRIPFILILYRLVEGVDGHFWSEVISILIYYPHLNHALLALSQTLI